MAAAKILVSHIQMATFRANASLFDDAVQVSQRSRNPAAVDSVHLT
jgi:hypothetical protein